MKCSLTNTKLQFPWKVHQLLENVEAEGSVATVSWLPHGRAFRVHNKPKFVSTVMGSYFNSTKYKSFQRNLNLWGFETINRGSDKGAIYHRFFIKNKPDLCARMTRQKIKGPSSDPSSDSSKTSSSAPGTLSDSVDAWQNGFPEANAVRAESILNALRKNQGLFSNSLGASDASLFGKGFPAEAGVSAYNTGASSRAEDTFVAPPQRIHYDRPGGPEAAYVAQLLAAAGMGPYAAPPASESSPKVSALMALLQNRSNPYPNTRNQLLDMANNSNRLSAEQLLGLNFYSRGRMAQAASIPLVAPANNQNRDAAALASFLSGVQERRAQATIINSFLASISAKI
jgi:hypothetical protein